jgi:hypothetical protein
MRSPRFARTAAVAGLCAVVGTAAGIATSGAQTTSSTSTSTTSSSAATGGGPGGGGPGMGGGFGGAGGMAVHSVSVVLDSAGTAFETVTQDSGTVVSESGDSLTLTEASKGVTYQTVTLTLPASATVVRDGATSSLSALQAGDTVRVSQSTDSTTVSAQDAAYAKTHQGGPGGRGGPGGHGAPGGLKGAPPAAAGTTGSTGTTSSS